MQFFNSYVARNLTYAFLNVFLGESKCSNCDWNRLWLHFPHFLHFSFKILFLDSLSIYLMSIFLSDGKAMSTIMHLFSFLSLIIVSGLLAFIFSSVLPSSFFLGSQLVNFVFEF